MGHRYFSKYSKFDTAPPRQMPLPNVAEVIWQYYSRNFVEMLLQQKWSLIRYSCTFSTQLDFLIIRMSVCHLRLINLTCSNKIVLSTNYYTISIFYFFLLSKIDVGFETSEKRSANPFNGWYCPASNASNARQYDQVIGPLCGGRKNIPSLNIGSGLETPTWDLSFPIPPLSRYHLGHRRIPARLVGFCDSDPELSLCGRQQTPLSLLLCKEHGVDGSGTARF